MRRELLFYRLQLSVEEVHGFLSRVVGPPLIGQELVANLGLQLHHLGAVVDHRLELRAFFGALPVVAVFLHVGHGIGQVRVVFNVGAALSLWDSSMRVEEPRQGRDRLIGDVADVALELGDLDFDCFLRHGCLLWGF